MSIRRPTARIYPADGAWLVEYADPYTRKTKTQRFQSRPLAEIAHEAIAKNLPQWRHWHWAEHHNRSWRMAEILMRHKGEEWPPVDVRGERSSPYVHVPRPDEPYDVVQLELATWLAKYDPPFSHRYPELRSALNRLGEAEWALRKHLMRSVLSKRSRYINGARRLRTAVDRAAEEVERIQGRRICRECVLKEGVIERDGDRGRMWCAECDRLLERRWAELEEQIPELRARRYRPRSSEN